MPLIEEIADVSDGPSGAPPDPDENYAAFTERRLEKEWEEQLEMARAANVGVDEHDVDVRDLYGEQSVHNYPDVHADWGDARHARATVARAARDAGAFPNAEASGWNTEYRAQLEHAMGVVRDSKEVMKNLKTIRRRKKDIDEGVEVGHLRGKSAKEANREWEASRAERRERERRRREAKAKAKAEAEAAAEREGPIAGLKKLPDFITRGRGAATSPLAEAHDRWLEALGDEPPRRNSVDSEARAAASRRKEPEATNPKHPEATTTTNGTTSAVSAATANDSTANDSDADSSSEDEDAETSFLKHLSSLSPLRRAAASKTEEADFWNREVYGGEDPSVEENMDAFEAEMARLCATEISAARNATTED